MMKRIPALYQPKPTLNELYIEDNTIFNSMTLPQGISNADIASVLLLKFKSLETIFDTAAEAKAGFTTWSAYKLANWERMYESLKQKYDPLENYSMTETMTNDETVTEYGKTTERTDNLTHSKTGTDTTSPDLTEEETPDETNTNTNDVYGFNSSAAVHDSENTTTRTGTNTRTTTGTSETEYNTEETDTGTQTTEDSGSDTQTRNYTLTRNGNIGVTTSQQMLESELVLRAKWNIYGLIAAEFQREMCVCVW